MKQIPEKVSDYLLSFKCCCCRFCGRFLLVGEDQDNPSTEFASHICLSMVVGFQSLFVGYESPGRKAAEGLGLSSYPYPGPLV